MRDSIINLFFKMKLYKYLNTSSMYEHYSSYIEYKCKRKKNCGEEKEWLATLSKILTTLPRNYKTKQNTIYKFFPNMIKRKRSNYTAFHKKITNFKIFIDTPFLILTINSVWKLNT